MSIAENILKLELLCSQNGLLASAVQVSAVLVFTRDMVPRIGAPSAISASEGRKKELTAILKEEVSIACLKATISFFSFNLLCQLWSSSVTAFS